MALEMGMWGIGLQSVSWAEGVDDGLGLGGCVEEAIGPDAAVAAAGGEEELGVVDLGAGEDVEGYGGGEGWLCV